MGRRASGQGSIRVGEESTRVPLERRICCAASRGIGKAPLSGSVKSSSESVEFTAVGDEGVDEGGGEDSLAASGGRMARAKGEDRGRGMEACSNHSR